ncbi:MAG: flavin reductase family protein [Actinobacteria bacterium]|nr:flavin reductase family protein [Actinomycetota bacterium]
MADIDGLTDILTELDYPMAVVTTASADERSGCLVGFMTQCSVDPPRFVVFLSDKNHTYTTALDADGLGVHFLHHDQRDLARLFGATSGDWSDKFDRCRWREGPLGVPVLEDVRHWVVGEITERVLGGDHVGFVLRPVAARADGPFEQLSFLDVRSLDPGHDP